MARTCFACFGIRLSVLKRSNLSKGIFYLHGGFAWRILWICIKQGRLFTFPTIPFYSLIHYIFYQHPTSAVSLQSQQYQITSHCSRNLSWSASWRVSLGVNRSQLSSSPRTVHTSRSLLKTCSLHANNSAQPTGAALSTFLAATGGCSSGSTRSRRARAWSCGAGTAPT